MFDMDELMKRAQAASDEASQQLQESMEKSRKIAEQAQKDAEKAAEDAAKRQSDEGQAAQQDAANQQRQVEILGQMFSPEAMAQMAVNQELIQQAVDEKVAAAAALGAEGMMDQLFGEDMGVIAAALETLAMEEEEEDGEDEDRELDQAMERELYQVLEEKLAQLDALPEPEPAPYARDDPRWGRFGILLSGIISTLNDHELGGMDVEEHIPSLVRRAWGINGRGELLDTIRYLTREGYTLRYALYCEADSPEELLEEGMDEEDRASVCRGGRGHPVGAVPKGGQRPAQLAGIRGIVPVRRPDVEAALRRQRGRELSGLFGGRRRGPAHRGSGRKRGPVAGVPMARRAENRIPALDARPRRGIREGRQ